MKIAAVSDNRETLTAHFGRANYYVVFTVENGKITDREVRPKPVHHGRHQEHDHNHEHHHGHDHADGESHERGHGFGRHAGEKHAGMIEPIEDCDVLLVRGMGRGAYVALQHAGIEPITTELKSIEEAVKAYVEGRLVDRPERRH